MISFLKRQRLLRLSALMLAVGSVAACGGGSGSGSGSSLAASYTVAVSAAGLSGNGLVLQLNGTDELSVNADGTAVFSTALTSGASYAVSVKTQPTAPIERCEISNGSGTIATSAINNISVLCTLANVWTWMGGAAMVDAVGSYGTLGSASAGSTPGARTAPSSWSDASGKFWLFGGEGYATQSVAFLNDLWRYDPSTGLWTWINGPNANTNTPGVYGTQGVAASSNSPGGRVGALSWADPEGNAWLFGGLGIGAARGGYLNDLWKYSASDNTWTWISGSNAPFGSSVYGTLGTAAAGNGPGARQVSSTWIDASGNLWLFGGHAADLLGNPSYCSDLWRFSPSSGLWTWIAGSALTDGAGTYGTQGVAALANSPGARYAAAFWTDSAGHFWLFGGYGYDSTGALGNLNDLWEFNPSTASWTWVGGSMLANGTGQYGTEGSAAAGNLPPARAGAAAWIGEDGLVRLFGGSVGFATLTPQNQFNDLWQWDPKTQLWTWIGGSNSPSSADVYGTLGIAAVTNTPGARAAMASWTDGGGNLWLFGGSSPVSSSRLNYYNDLWRYAPSP